MEILNKIKYIVFLSFIFSAVIVPLVALTFYFSTTPARVYAATTRIDLGTADVFAILAGAAVTGTDTNSVTGNVGLSPTGGTGITALTCAEVTGTIYDTNGGYSGGGGGSTACLTTDAGVLTTAKNDLSAAYTNAAGRTPSPDIATDLAGVTLTSGVYKSAAGTFSITGGGTVTLNGEGDADAVFIFQMASTLITSTSSRVVLTNGAQECNVYWQVGSSATLGNSSTMVGNVMAYTTITANTGSTVDGRLFAASTTDITGAVTILNNTTITKKTCASPTATPTPTSAPTATPTPTPTPTPSSSSNSSSSGSSSSTSNTTTYPALSNTIIAPIIIDSRRVDSDSISISWGPYSGIDTFNVQYGLENGKWLYNTRVTGFSTTINALPSNQPIWVQIAAYNGTIGNYGEAKLVGGPSLPDAGSAPRQGNISQNIAILAGVIMLVSALPVVFLKKRTFSRNRTDGHVHVAHAHANVDTTSGTVSESAPPKQH